MSLAGAYTILNYTKKYDSPPEQFYYDDNRNRSVQGPGDDPHKIGIGNGWPFVGSFSLDRHGFSLQDFDTDFADWQDSDQVQQSLYPTVIDFLKKTTGASRVHVFDHTIRSRENSAKPITHETDTTKRAPLMYVHCDYTAESGPSRVRQLLPDEADNLLSRRLAFINVWKPINHAVEECPLAMCDVASASEEDYFKLILRYRNRTGENYVMQYAPEHKWWYFPNMSPEHAILLKTYDSATDGTARFVGHSAFKDPSSLPDARLRESIEIRTIAFF